MSTNSHTLAGKLMVKTVTPVIQALFANYFPEAPVVEDGEVFIAIQSEGFDSSWDNTHERLAELATTLDLVPDDADSEEVLTALAEHFGGTVPSGLLTVGLADDTINLEDLKALADVFNDGHGLTGFFWESSWVCSRLRYREFGGAGTYFSNQVAITGASGDYVELGQRLDAALHQSTDDAAQVVAAQLEAILDSIADDAARDSIRQKVAAKLSV